MEKLIEKYGQPLIDLVIKIDDLTIEEVADHEYLEDRIITHLDWATIVGDAAFSGLAKVTSTITNQ